MAEAGDSTAWSFGRRATARNIERARGVYVHCAESTERSLNALDASASRLRARWRAVMPEARVGERYERHAARRRQGLRDLAMRLVVASDATIRAGFDCADSMIQARDGRDVVDLQAAFLREHALRSVRLAIDLQRMAAEAAQRNAAGLST